MRRLAEFCQTLNDTQGTASEELAMQSRNHFFAPRSEEVFGIFLDYFVRFECLRVYFIPLYYFFRYLGSVQYLWLTDHIKLAG